MYAKIFLVALAAVAAAIPTNWDSQDDQPDVCGNGQTVHCCNAETAKEVSSRGFIPITGDLQNLLGQCSDITGAIAGGAANVNPACSQQSVCCGHSSQGGLIGLSCIPINV
ncbi:hypothetical protein QQS21_000044 [Conoideocrella luteorostrata]|uniref:Hydrophobin n=1 Tax=Conoideocrella luteorostrata TaxID=1105319 RepID=A0AAJ0FZJ0_9HYPO|nr:hypothetical protein QQS21_000044 [Conoideocrella luteorostrata]